MLRIRAADGAIHAIPRGCSLEFVDDRGRLAVVVTQGPDGTVGILTPGDPVFLSYASIHRLAISKVSVHEPAPPMKTSL